MILILVVLTTLVLGDLVTVLGAVVSKYTKVDVIARGWGGFGRGEKVERRGKVEGGGRTCGQTAAGGGPAAR